MANKWKLFLSLLLLVFTILVLLEEDGEVQDQPSAVTAAKPHVLSVTTAHAAPYQQSLQVRGQIEAAWVGTLYAPVSGAVHKTAPLAVAGASLKKGDELYGVNISEYQRDFERAKAAMLEAEIAYQEDLDEHQIKRKQWQGVLNKKPSERALNIPQRKVSEYNLKSARNQLRHAKEQINKATMYAPFDLTVKEKLIADGQQLEAGTAVFRVISSKQQIKLGLLNEQLVRLSDDWKLQALQFYCSANKSFGTARVSSGGRYTEGNSLQRIYFLNILSAAECVAGEQVKLILPGKTYPRALEVPESSISREGYLWTVDENASLQKLKAKVIDTIEGAYVIEAPATGNSYRIARYPLRSFSNGQQVLLGEKQEAKL